MQASGLTGSRIRAQRITAGLKQAALAQLVGISPAYLNLIEHNRRRIAGKLLNNIAEALGVDPTSLEIGAEATTVAALRTVAAVLADSDDAAQSPLNPDEFASHFPDWAQLILSQHSRIEALERRVEHMSDRMAHDPQLAASLHDLLSMVTAIGAASAILVETDEIEAEWRDRFHRNIHEDSQRLSASSQALVSYLEDTNRDAGNTAPQDELETWLHARDYHVPDLERALPRSNAILFGDAPEISSNAGQAQAARYFARYQQDAKRMPLAAFSAATQRGDLSPLDLADQFGVDLASVLRRIASLATPEGAARIGVVVCDGSGTLTFRKPVDGFEMPRFGAPCALWPLYQALARPLSPVRSVVETAGRDKMRFVTYAVAQPIGTTGFDAPQVYEATMLIVPADRVPLPELPVQEIGMSCRICSRPQCQARREPSHMAEDVPSNGF